MPALELLILLLARTTLTHALADQFDQAWRQDVTLLRRDVSHELTLTILHTASSQEVQYHSKAVDIVLPILGVPPIRVDEERLESLYSGSFSID